MRVVTFLCPSCDGRYGSAIHSLAKRIRQSTQSVAVLDLSHQVSADRLPQFAGTNSPPPTAEPRISIAPFDGVLWVSAGLDAGTNSQGDSQLDSASVSEFIDLLSRVGKLGKLDVLLIHCFSEQAALAEFSMLLADDILTMTCAHGAQHSSSALTMEANEPDDAPTMIKLFDGPSPWGEAPWAQFEEVLTKIASPASHANFATAH